MSRPDDTRATETTGSRADDTTDLRSRSKRPVLEHGKQIGRYKLLGVLGKGGMGVVYRAHDPELARDLAIKVLHRNLSEHGDRLQREAQAIARLKHPNVVTVYDVGVDGDELFIAMELVENGTLRAWASGRRWKEIVAMFAAAGRGLAAAHEAEVVHRDFKPDNVLVTRDGRAVVSDFGIAEVAGDTGGIGSASGTPAYMSPEQLEAGTVDARCDQFSFCVALWETLYGERPFAYGRGATPDDILASISEGRLREVADRRGVPARIHAALARGLSRAPGDRFPSMNELLAELAPRQRPWGVIAAIAVAAIAAAVAVFAMTRADRRLFAGAPPAGCDARASAVWDDAARAKIGADPEAQWFDAYATRADLARRTLCAARDPGATRVLGCLDGAIDDLRAAIARPDRARWPILRPIASCVTPAAAPREQPIGAVNLDEILFLSRDAGTIAVSRVDGAWLRGTDGSEPRREPTMTRPIRWLDDGTLLGDDGNGGHLIAIDPADGHVVRTIATGIMPAAIHDVSPDLSHVVYDDRAETTTWLAPIGGTPVTVIGGEVGRNHVRFSPDGTRVGMIVTDGRPSVLALVIREVASGAEVRIPLHLQTGSDAVMTWLDDDHVAIGGSIDGTRNALWRLHVGAGGLVDPPEPLVEGGPDTQLAAFDATAGHVLVERETTSRRMRTIGVGDDASVVAAPGALADMIPYGADPASQRVLVSQQGDPPRWFVVSWHDWSSQPVTAPSGEVVHQAEWRHGNVVALAVAADGWHYVEGASDVALAGTAGLDPLHIGFRCAGAICVVRWHAPDGMYEVRVDDGGAAAPAASPFPPGKGADWALLPDGRRALILVSDHHTVSIEGGAKPVRVASNTCRFAMAFAATDATSVTMLCANADGSSRLVRMPLDGSPATSLATSPDIFLGATMVDPTHALVTSIVEAATVSLVTTDPTADR